MNTKQLKELILQSLEHERGGVRVYEAALECAVNDELKEEWTKYLEETENHVQTLVEVCEAMKLDSEEETVGRAIVREQGASLVKAIEKARDTAGGKGAQLVACECVVLAETKDHTDWELLSAAAKEATGETAKALREAVASIEDQEDEHLYHSKGWCRELWLESLGMRAVLPPPEERRDVKTAIGAARAEQDRNKMR